MRTDLHVHSWFSDGKLSPREVVQRAQRAGLGLIALTDHDTTAGHAEAATEARRLGLTFVPGVEFTCRGVDDEIHLLAYHVDETHPAIRALCETTQRRLRERLLAVIERMRGHGWEVGVDEVERMAPHTRVLDRPHLAWLMMARGWVPSQRAAFERHLAPGGDCFVPFEGHPAADVIAIVRAAGGLAALAHPRYFNHPEGATEQSVAPLVEAGLGGIEVFHAAHGAEETARFLAIAHRFGLVVTGGSDCHGIAHADGRLGLEHPVVPDWVGPQFLERCAHLAGAG